MVLPKTTGPLGIREPHYNNINEFAVFVKVISEAIFSCGIIEAAQKQFTRALGLIWCRVSHFHDFFLKKSLFQNSKNGLLQTTDFADADENTETGSR